MADFNASLDLVARLVKQFHTNRAAYRAPDYKEAHARQDLIDPLFIALGWDVHNEERAAPQYREVILEDSLEVEGEDTRKAPDYAFRIGETRKFFAEAKKPGVAIKTAARPAYQLRRYAWSAKLPLSLLTDFEELSIYDCRSRPSEKDKATAGRINFYTFEEYADRWREIWNVFSREAVRGGSFDQFVQAGKGRGTSEVDAEFLREIEGWRDVLAHNMALRNPNLGIDDLNDAVQRTIDRIIFLRMAEDRHIEPYEQLCRLADKEDSYSELIDLCRKADARYNAGLFNLSPTGDRITPTLNVDDKVLKPIVTSLYFPQSPYEFSVLPIRVLGNIYEQFLGKVIRLTAAHQAKVEEKPEVRKAGGVFYTPEYIVDYIVKNTVGKLVEGKSPKQLASFRALDMACGSGSFLLGAYQFLLDYYLQWYIEHSPGKYPNAVWQRGEEWRLTIAEKKRILTTHVYGVDIDRQAVEVTKLSLLLKVLEGESTETLQMALPGFQERALPNLDNNVKCGNSLIEPDYFTGQLLPDADELRRVNPFDWATQFPDAMKAGGFDCIVGNPPYIRIQTMKEWAPLEVEAYKQLYTAASSGNYDIYVVFVECAFSLLKKQGQLGLILPHKFFQSQFGQSIRQLLSQKKVLVEVVHFGAEQVFQNATTYTCLLFLSPMPHGEFRFVSVKSLNNPHQLFRAIQNASPHPNYSEASLPQPPAGEAEWHFSIGGQDAVLAKLRQQSLTLGDITRKIFVGLQTSADKIYVLKILEWRKKTVLCYSQSLEQEVEIERGLVKPFLMGKDVHRYEPVEANNVVIFPYVIENGKAVLMSQAFIQKHFSKGWQYLLANKDALARRENGKMRGDNFYAYIYPKNLAEFEAVKVMTPEIALGCQLTFDVQGIFYHTTKVYSFIFNEVQKESALFFLGILNSKLLWCFLQATGYTLRGGYFTFKTEYLKPFPIRTINFSDPADAARHDRMVTLVEQMLELHKRLAAASQADRELYQRQIDATDREIDRLVYELYRLTEEEIKIVEGND